MKKFFVILLVIFVCIFFAAVFHKPKSDKTVIKFSSWGSQSETALLVPLIEKFEKQNPDIKIEFLHIPQNYFQKLHLLFASNLAPDVVFINNYYAPKYVKAGLLEDLTPYIEKKEFFEKSLAGFTFDEKTYALPRDISVLVIYYNKNLFKKYGLPLPENGWSLEEYVKTARLLSKDTNNDRVNDVWGTSFETDMIFLLPYLMSSGYSVDSLQQFADLANKYNAAPKKSQSASLTMAQLFLQQKIAMHLSGRWLVPKYREEAQFDWDIVSFPKGPEGSIVNIDASGYAVSKSSKHKKEAFKFVEFISSKESLNTLTKSGLIVPARKDSAYCENFLSVQKPKNASVFLKTIENGKPTPVDENYQKNTDRLKMKLEPVFLGQKKAKDVFSSAVIMDFNR